MNRKIILFLLILVSVCAISHASAADDSNNVTIDSSDTIGEIDEDLIVDFDDKLNDDENSFRAIQKEIDSANDGDTINLTGEYDCDYIITVNKSVNLVGTGNGAVIKWKGVEKNYTSPFFNVESPNVNFTNIKFIGAMYGFAGVFTWRGDNGTIANCEFRDCTANNDEIGIGGALFIIGENCTIINSTFENNRAFKYGGAILTYGSNTRIINTKFKNNVADGPHGGALMIYADNCLVENSTFTNNHCKDFGGAISVGNVTHVVIKDSEFYDNYVTSNLTDEFVGGGAINSFSIGLIIDNCKFIGNNATNSLGGAVYLGINNTVKNSYFNGNNALFGNDIFASNSSKVTFNHFVLANDELVEDSIFGISEENLIKANNTFEWIKVPSDVRFSAGMIFEYGKSGSISVSVEGGWIEHENIRVLNHPEAKISYINNILSVSGLAVGKYTLRVTATPDDYHFPVDADLSITVNKATAVIKASKITVALKKGTLWTIKLVDSKTGNAISNMKLTLKIYTGKKYKTVSVKTNSKGEATYQTKGLTQGTHKVVISGSDANYNFNTLTSSIKVVKQTQLKFTVKKKVAKDGSTLSITVKKGKKGVNGIKLKVLVFTGKKLTKTVILKSKTKSKLKGVCGWGTNRLSTGTHKIVIMPADIKYGGSKTVKLPIKKSASKYPKWETKI